MRELFRALGLIWPTICRQSNAALQLSQLETERLMAWLAVSSYFELECASQDLDVQRTLLAC